MTVCADERGGCQVAFEMTRRPRRAVHLGQECSLLIVGARFPIPVSLEHADVCVCVHLPKWRNR